MIDFTIRILENGYIVMEGDGTRPMGKIWTFSSKQALTTWIISTEFPRPKSTSRDTHNKGDK